MQTNHRSLRPGGRDSECPALEQTWQPIVCVRHPHLVHRQVIRQVSPTPGTLLLGYHQDHPNPTLIQFSPRPQTGAMDADR